MARLLVDNWSMERATSTLLACVLARSGRLSNGAVGDDLWIGDPVWMSLIEPGTCDWRGILSILQLIEDLVLYDELAFVGSRRSGWWRFYAPVLGELKELVQSIAVESADLHTLREDAAFLADGGSSLSGRGARLVVAEGALFYLLLAQRLEIPYRPCVDRSEYLLQMGQVLRPMRTGEQARERVIEYLDREALEICAQIRDRYGLEGSTLRIPPIAGYVLRSIRTIEELPVAVSAVRQSRAGVALREWFSGLDRALSQGDVLMYGKQMAEVEAVFDDLKCSLGLLSKDDGPELTFGATWPSVTIRPKKLLRKLRSKRKLHLTLLRKLIHRLLSYRNFAPDIERVFGVPEAVSRRVEQNFTRLRQAVNEVPPSGS